MRGFLVAPVTSSCLIGLYKDNLALHDIAEEPVADFGKAVQSIAHDFEGQVLRSFRRHQGTSESDHINKLLPL